MPGIWPGRGARHLRQLQQPARPEQRHALLLRLREQLLGQALLIDDLARHGINHLVASEVSRPLDDEAVIRAARETAGIITAEEGMQAGGLGGAVCEVTAAHAPTRVHTLGFPDTFATTGSPQWLTNHYGFDCQGIVDAAHKLLRS